MPNFPKPVARSGGPSYSPGACPGRESTRIIYITACAFLPRINVFRRSFLVRGETRRRQVQIYGRTFPERACLSDPAALITFHEISNSSRSFPPLSSPPPQPSLTAAWTPRRRDRVTDVYPSRGDPDGYAGSMGTKGCWFNVEGVFVVLMRYNGMDPGC